MTRACPDHATLAQDGEAERWNALYEAAAWRTPFDRLDYVRAAASAARLRLGVHIVSDAQRDLASAAVAWKRRGPWREVIAPPFTPFSAVMLRDPLDPSGVHARNTPLESLLAELEAGYDRIHLHLSPEYADARFAQWRGWTVRPLYTYRLRTADGPETWSRGAARTFRTGEAAYDVFEGNEAVPAAVRLAAASYARQRRKIPLNVDALEALAQNAGQRGWTSSFAARRRDSGEIHAGIVAIRSGRTAWYWVVGSIPGPAMTVLLGKTLPRLHASGVETFDLMGANTPGVAEFKRRFGAKLTPYYRIGFCKKPVLQWLAALREKRA